MAERRPTEAALAGSRALDEMSSEEVLRLIHHEDGMAHAAVGEVLPRMAEAVEVLARFRPATMGQASRLAGVNPADLTLLAVVIRRGRFRHGDRPVTVEAV